MTDSPRRHLRLAAAAALVALMPLGLSAQPADPAPQQQEQAPQPKPEAAPPQAATPAAKGEAEAVSDAAAMALFLDRLMMAESGGRDDARNARSTAVGPFQFIESTFIEVTRRHFADEVDELPPAAVLKLRTNRAFARRAAEAFTRDNAAHLAVAGLPATFPNLRLAYLVGPGGAVRVLKAPADTPIGTLLGTPVLRANPFMVRMTTSDLVAWSARNLASAALAQDGVAADPARVARNRTAGKAKAKAEPSIPVRCSRGLVSCRRWISLAKKRVIRQRVAGNKGNAPGR